MSAKLNSEIHFVFNAIVIALIVMAVLHTIKPMVEGPDPRKAEVEEFATQIQVVPADAVPAKLQRGQPVLLVIYASWCGPCRREMPVLVDLIKDHTFAGYSRVFLSLDNEAMALSNYLVHADYHHLFPPIIVRPDTVRLLAGLLQPLGSHFNGMFPYVALLDAQGRVVADFTDVTPAATLRKAAEKLASPAAEISG